ncbi:hypothetical protein SAMN04488134_108118 [Amphibacillus marinus]|uniref:Uncharacterized protein n=1 Tax=Amphibacillus marinus TaxID=872970 RepID=A0A1H8QCX5_9BACI|nr:hypothetical protein [Amphibacillus marinus]SEO51858.1 hypothetical protein SAMN04488134_108118 [Amphibacillus marinus]
MFKKVLLTIGLIASVIVFIGCQQAAEGGDLFFYTQTADEIANWTSMVTPGGGEGSVELGDDVAIIKAAEDGWGGVQSEEVSIDLTKDPMFFVRVKEANDGFMWGAKFVPNSPAIDEHAWGVYLIEDNDFKWNNYAAVELKDKLGEDFISLYGEEIEGVLWIYATGGPEAEVEISEVKMLNQE